MLENVISSADSVLTFGLMVGCFVCWAVFIQKRRQSKWTLLEPRNRIQSPLGLVDVGMMFLMWFVGIAIAFEFVGPESIGTPRTAAIIGLTQLMMTVLAIGVLAFRYGPASWIIGWQPDRKLEDIRIGVIVFFMAVPPILLIQALLVQWIPYEHASLEMLKDPKGLLTAWFTAVLVAPICEEVFFRGMLQGWLQRIDIKAWFAPPTDNRAAGPPYEIIGGGYLSLAGEPAIDPADANSGTQTPIDVKDTFRQRYLPKLVDQDSNSVWMPIVVASAFFASMHIGQGPAPIPLFLLSVVLGLVYHRTHSILTCIVVHMLLNGFSIALGTIQAYKETGAEAAMLW